MGNMIINFYDFFIISGVKRMIKESMKEKERLWNILNYKKNCVGIELLLDCVI